MNYSEAIELRASSATSSNGSSSPVDLGPTKRLLELWLDVTVFAATSLLVDIESAPSSAGPWRSCGPFERQVGEETYTSALVAIGAVRLVTVAYDRFVRVRWAFTGGTPSATFSVAGTKGISYANLEDLITDGPGRTVLQLSVTARGLALAKATAKADSKLSLRYDLPLVAWGADLSEAVAKIAGYDALSSIGFNPEGADQHVRDRHNDGLKWLREVADSHANPQGLIDSTPAVEDDGIAVVTRPPRWAR